MLYVFARLTTNAKCYDNNAFYSMITCRINLPMDTADCEYTATTINRMQPELSQNSKFVIDTKLQDKMDSQAIEVNDNKITIVTPRTVYNLTMER